MAATSLSNWTACKDKNGKSFCFREQHCLITADLLRMCGTGIGPAEAFWRPRVHRSNLTHKKTFPCPRTDTFVSVHRGTPRWIRKDKYSPSDLTSLTTTHPTHHSQHHSSPLTPQLPFTIQAKAMTSISHYLVFFFPHGQADPACSSVLPRLITSTHTTDRAVSHLALSSQSPVANDL